MTLPSVNEGGSLNPMSFTDAQGSVMLERLRYQRETGRFCDAVIKCEGRIFTAHRNVLACSSPYFDAILKKNIVTKEQITINCKNPVAFDLMLNYIYTGIVCIDRSSIEEVLTLANNFLLMKLKTYCAEYLSRNIDTANALTVLRLSQKFNLPTVHKAASDFFDVNVNRCLMDCVDLLSYKYTKLRDLIEKHRRFITPDAHLRVVTRWASEDIEGRFDHFRVLLNTIHMGTIQSHVIDYVMDYSEIMKDPRARLFLLHNINITGLALGKYHEEYDQLMVEMGDTLNGLGGMGSEGEDEDMYMEDEAAVEGERSAKEIIGSEKRAYSIATDENWTKVKLKLKPGAAPAAGGEKEKKKRGRRPKDSIAGTSSECTIDEDGVDGVYCVSEEAVMYPDMDSLDPSSVHDEEESENVSGGQAMCEHCKYATDEAEDLRRHVALRHDHNTVLVCTMCDEGYESRWSKPFYEHVGAHFQDTSTITCEECEYSTSEGVAAFLNHRLMHYPKDRPFKCLACGWRGSTRTQLWAHERIHTGACVCACLICGRSFKRQEALDHHMMTHNDRRTMTCVDCGWVSKTESDLNAHRAVRHQLDVYTCHITGCDYVSTKKSQLAAHLRTHLAVRAHLCRICGRGFIEKSHVVRHERIHLTEKPFKCESCDYASSRRDKLKEHILKYHNGTNNGGSGVAVKQVQRRRQKRAKELAQAIANQSQSRGLDVLFRPIESSRERIEQWHQGLNHTHHNQMQAPRALSVVAPPMGNTGNSGMHSMGGGGVGAQHGMGGGFHHPASPGSLSLMNQPIGGLHNDSPMPLMEMGGGVGQKMPLHGLRLEESPLVTPVPRSPHNHSDPFHMGNTDESQRPMSLPPYGGQHNWFT